MNVRTSGIARSIACAVGIVGLGICSLGRAAQPGTAVEAIWYAQNLDFHFRSAYVGYSCPALKAKLAAILQSVGVSDSTAMRCIGTGFSRSLQLQFQAQSPIEATAANLAAVTNYDATRKLLAHLHGEQLPSAADVPRFNARWQRVDLHRQRKLQLDPGDCELLQQVSRQLFPKLAIEVELDGLNCHSGSATRIGHPLRVVALLPDKQSGRVAPRTEET